MERIIGAECPYCLQRKETCICGASRFTLVDTEQYATTLVNELTGVVDFCRDINTYLGERQYRISLIWTRWSGGHRGIGQEVVDFEIPVLPTPVISDLKNVGLELTPIGINESGGIFVAEISPRYPESMLLGNDIVVRPGQELPQDVNFFWEVFFPATMKPGERRRFTPKSPPNKDPTGFEWTIRLIRAQGGRTETGEVATG